eukprot:TRINITY_DN396_c0_g1_i10.p1 TRINITY_DN396_c0_g1~~TRINITY_DN396_c0_g1_i10.p1  ORF type:complete len:349 (-),score=53.39 TRINITY_DN396_c0_g1_i10:31-1077(-)
MDSFTASQLAETDVLPIALGFCSGDILCALRCTGHLLADALPASSPTWDALLRTSYAWLGRSPATPSMVRAGRLRRATERCQLQLGQNWSALHCEMSKSPAIQACGQDLCERPLSPELRHRLIVTGARHSGISTLVRMMTHGLDDQEPPCSLAAPRGQDMCISSVCAVIEGRSLDVSVVDKRSTVISTPLSASLYKGHTACLFAFDAGRLEETVVQAAMCIEELQQTVGPAKFHRMTKLLICHKADLLPSQHAATSCLDSPAWTLSLPPMCRALMETYGMDLVFTTQQDTSSAELAFALAAAQWPQDDPDDAMRHLLSRKCAMRHAPTPLAALRGGRRKALTTPCATS